MIKQSEFLYRIPMILFVIVLAAVLGWIAGYRPFGNGFDFGQYWNFYYKIGQFSSVHDFRFEPSFVLLAKFSSLSLGLDYSAFAAIFSAICLIAKFFVLGEQKNKYAAIFFYILVYYPIHENTQIRVAFATSIVFISTKFLFKSKWSSYLLLSILAASFHMSAVIASLSLAAAYAISKYNLNYGIIASVICAGLIPFSVPYLFPTITMLNSLMVSSISESEPPNIFSIVNIITFLFLVCSAISGSVSDRRSKTFFLVACAGFVAFAGFYSIPVMAHRLKEMLLVFMTFIAFEYRMTERTYPQAALATALALGSLYESISTGFFSDGYS